MEVENKGLWSGRGDLNARPPAPKTDSGAPGIRLIFNYLDFKQIRAACWKLLRFVEGLGLRIYKIIYTPRFLFERPTSRSFG